MSNIQVYIILQGLKKVLEFKFPGYLVLKYKNVLWNWEVVHWLLNQTIRNRQTAYFLEVLAQKRTSSTTKGLLKGLLLIMVILMNNYNE